VSVISSTDLAQVIGTTSQVRPKCFLVDVFPARFDGLGRVVGGSLDRYGIVESLIGVAADEVGRKIGQRRQHGPLANLAADLTGRIRY